MAVSVNILLPHNYEINHTATHIFKHVLIDQGLIRASLKFFIIHFTAYLQSYDSFHSCKEWPHCFNFQNVSKQK